jgi:hypothetical protein
MAKNTGTGGNNTSSQAQKGGRKAGRTRRAARNYLDPAQLADILARAEQFEPPAKPTAQTRNAERQVIATLLKRKATTVQIRAFLAECGVTVGEDFIRRCRREIQAGAPAEPVAPPAPPAPPARRNRPGHGQEDEV